MPYLFLYWHQGLRNSEPQQVLFAMALPSIARGIAWKNARPGIRA